jgi:hypothetical protein
MRVGQGMGGGQEEAGGGTGAEVQGGGDEGEEANSMLEFIHASKNDVY